MDPYSISSQLASEVVTKSFSTSFSSAITLFEKSIQVHIYNVYGLVRVADEIVDTYKGVGALKMLDDLESEVYSTLGTNFSANIIVHAFCISANKFGIDRQLIEPFFKSMRMDITKKQYSQNQYQQYIYGSAEVVGLMCLKIFTHGDETEFNKLIAGAKALGSAFQKVNFLRDIKDDYETRGRYYFPVGSYQTFDDQVKEKIIDDIQKDFELSYEYIDKLPKNSRHATKLAYEYYSQLLTKLKLMSAEDILKSRIRIGMPTKLKILLKAKIGAYV